MTNSLLHRYLVKELLLTTGVITFVLILIVLSARLIVYLNKAATGELATQLVFMIVGLHLPFFLQIILPLGFFISILLVFGRLYTDNEMVVINSCGIGSRFLLKTLSFPILLIGLLTASFAMILSPLGAQLVDELVKQQETRSDLNFIAPGRFTHLGNSRVVYTEKNLDNEQGLASIFVGTPESIIIAQSAKQEDFLQEDQKAGQENANKYLSLEQGYQFKLFASGLVDLMVFKEYSIKIPSAVSRLTSFRQEAKPTAELFNSPQPKDQAQWLLRLAMVLIVPISALIAFPMAKVEPRQGRYAKLLPAIILYVTYYSAIILSTSLLADGKMDNAIGIWAVHALFLTMGIILNIQHSWHSLGDFFKRISYPHAHPYPSSTHHSSTHRDVQ